jgi:arylsulfatase A-like enzyme
MPMRYVLLLAVAAFAGHPALCHAQTPATRPNVILILADDYGYGDCGVNGCKDIPTPHIDSIAKNGIRCAQGYISAPQCSPTRAGILTGRYQQRFGHETNQSHEGSALPLSERTLAERLRAAGYVTGLVGKWHLGLDEKHHPQNRGFGEFFGFLGGANPYLPKGKVGVVPRILRGKDDAKEKEHLTDAFAREAVAFIDRHKKEPFFLYLAFNAPHGPMEAPEQNLKRFAAIKDEKRRTYAAMVWAMDAAIGRVLAKLRETGLEENTLIIFLSDNGGPTDVNGSSNRPFRGVKGEVREGGVRTPFFLQWKARINPTKSVWGESYPHPVISLDIHPTVLAAAGVKVAADANLDGVNLLPYLDGAKKEPPHEALYWRFGFPPARPEMHKWAIRVGDWKLFTDIDANRKRSQQEVKDGNLKLVNLANDITESKDLSKEHPDKFKELHEAWKKWNAQMAPVPKKRDKGERAAAVLPQLLPEQESPEKLMRAYLKAFSQAETTAMHAYYAAEVTVFKGATLLDKDRGGLSADGTRDKDWKGQKEVLLKAYDKAIASLGGRERWVERNKTLPDVEIKFIPLVEKGSCQGAGEQDRRCCCLGKSETRCRNLSVAQKRERQMVDHR